MRSGLKLAVTCGPTYEPIDEVRRITNFSTGRLGTKLGNFLTALGHEVFSLRGHYATYTGPNNAAHIIPFTTTENLAENLRRLAETAQIEAVFHAAAVADFRVDQILDESGASVQGRKISSRAGSLALILMPTVKIIRNLRAWFPQARLFGWKFEVEGNRDQALANARHQIQECATDVCVVNGRAYGEGFGVLVSDGQFAHCPDEVSLFETLHDGIA